MTLQQMIKSPQIEDLHPFLYNISLKLQFIDWKNIYRTLLSARQCKRNYTTVNKSQFPVFKEFIVRLAETDTWRWNQKGGIHPMMEVNMVPCWYPQKGCLSQWLVVGWIAGMALLLSPQASQVKMSQEASCREREYAQAQFQEDVVDRGAGGTAKEEDENHEGSECQLQKFEFHSVHNRESWG